MKKSITLPFLLMVVVSFICMTTANAQITLILQPNGADGKDVVIDSYSPNWNSVNTAEFNAQAWTNGGNPGNQRGLVDFNLSGIPAGATIQSAYLTLYNDPTSSNGLQNGQHSHLTGSNASVLQRIVTPWSESTCTWNTQPSYTSQNEVILPQDTNPNQDYVVNVLALIQDTRANPSSSFGFMLRQQVESPYRCLLFASSDHPDAAKHPKLVITYVLPCVNILTLQPNGTDGKDVVIDSYATTWNSANTSEFNSQAWTTGGNPSNQRGLVDFNLSGIPVGANILSAYLTLYNHPTSSNGLQNGQHSHLTGSNASVLQRIITPWSENTCTWNTQPSYTGQNEVVLPQDTNPNQDYIVNVLALIQDMIANPSGSFGFMLRQQIESPYHCLLFASSDYPDAVKRPKLVITYTVPLVATVTPSGTMSLCTGNSVTLTANAGAGYTYKWYRNNVLLSVTTQTFTTATQGTYKCVVTAGSCGTSTSNSVVVSVISNPTATVTYNSPLTFCSPGSVTLTANALSNVTYQWEKNNVTIAGATLQSYTATTAGAYRVKETRNGCSGYSSAKTVATSTSVSAAIGTSDPTTVCAGGTVNLSVTDAIPGYAYQWRSNNSIIGGATGASYVASVSGSYSVTAIAYCGTAASNSIAVSVGTLTAQVSPAGNVVACTGGSITLTANSGNGFTWQWQKNGVNIPGANSATYVATSAGSYTVNMTSPCGYATSAATIITQSNVTADVAPAGTSTICSGSSITFAANAGTGYTYKWYRNNVLLSATGQTFTSGTDGSYKVQVSINGSCAVMSNTVILNVINNPIPTITAGGPTTFCAGGSVLFTANTVAGATYQWQKNSINIPGATAQTYTASSAGSYRVQETMSECIKYSSKKTVTINCRLGHETTDQLYSDEVGSEIKMDVFPNPFADKLNIEITSPVTEQTEIKVVDVLGKLQYKQLINTNTSTELSLQLPAGVYLITSTVNGKSAAVRVIKTK